MKVPEQHTIGHTALTIVQSIFAHADCLSEPLQNDYGEDLVVLPSQNGEADTFSVFVQVKGINSGRCRASSIRIKRDHLRRWHDILTPVLICVHDFSTGKTLATNARRLRNRWAFANVKSEGERVPLSAFQELTASTASSILWQCRIEYIERHMYIILGESADLLALDKELVQDDPADIHLYATEVLSLLGIFVTDGVSAQLSTTLLAMLEKHLEGTAERQFQTASILSVVDWVNTVQCASMGLTILTWLSEAIGFWLQELHPETWARLCEKSRDDWSPYGKEN